MERKPPMFPGTPSRNFKNTKESMEEDKGNMSGNISRDNNIPGTPKINPNKGGTQNIRPSSRGSFLDDIEDGDYPPKRIESIANPVNLRSINTTMEHHIPLTSDRKLFPETTHRQMGGHRLAENEVDHLQKLRKDIDRKMDLEDLDFRPNSAEERERIRILEEELNYKREDLEKQKMRLEKKQLYDLNEKETRLYDRLEEIKRQKEEDRQFKERLRQEVILSKLEQKKNLEEKKNIERMLWISERDTKMEEFVRKKLELERLQENTKYLDDISNRRKLELDGIHNEMKARDLESAELLQKALNHADFIQDQIESGAIDKEYQAKLVHVLSGNKDDPENKKLREELLEELKAKILQQKEQKQMDNQRHIQELNMKRMEFSEAEKKINEQKLLHEAISRRGVDFLSELELGNAPPLEYVVKNLNIDEKQINRREPFSIRDVVQTTKDNLAINEERLKRLREDKEKSDAILKKIEYKPEPMFIPDQTQEVLDYIFDIIINKAWEEISMYDQYVDGLRKRSKVLKGREPVQDARIALYSDRISMKEINSDIIHKIVVKMIKEIAQEANGVNEMAKLSALNIIIKAFKVQKGSEMDENTIAGILLGMQMQQVKEK
jgi:hypothetical protein